MNAASEFEARLHDMLEDFHQHYKALVDGVEVEPGNPAIEAALQDAKRLIINLGDLSSSELLVLSLKKHLQKHPVIHTLFVSAASELNLSDLKVKLVFQDNKENYHPNLPQDTAQVVEDQSQDVPDASLRFESDPVFLGKRKRMSITDHFVSDVSNQNFRQQLWSGPEGPEFEEGRVAPIFKPQKAGLPFFEKEFSSSMPQLFPPDEGSADKDYLMKEEELLELQTLQKRGQMRGLRGEEYTGLNWHKRSESHFDFCTEDEYLSWADFNLEPQKEFQLDIPDNDSFGQTSRFPSFGYRKQSTDDSYHEERSSLPKLSKPPVEIPPHINEFDDNAQPELKVEVKTVPGRKMVDPLMEAKILGWLKHYSERRKAFPDKHKIKEKALILTSCPQFKASKGWMDKFFKRNASFLQELKKKAGITATLPFIPLVKPADVESQEGNLVLNKLRKRYRDCTRTSISTQQLCNLACRPSQKNPRLRREGINGSLKRVKRN